MSKVLLYSGGTDSWLIDRIWKPDTKIYINIDGMYSKEEMDRLPSDVIIVNAPFLGALERPDGIVPLRNLYFLMIASNFGDEICLGATRGDRGGKDKRPHFFRLAQRIMNYCLVGNSYEDHSKVKVISDFYNKSKVDLVEMYLDAGGTIEEFIDSTFSCYSPEDGHECLACKPCYRKFLLGYYFGYKYSDEQKRKMIDYLQSEIIPDKLSGTYFTKRAGEGWLDEIAVDELFNEFGLDWMDYK